jgi:hypothetical protein
MKFASVVELGGKTATGIVVPEEVVTALGSGKRPAVKITVNAHTYRTRVAPMSGRYFVPLSAENREAAGVAAGEAVEVSIELDAEPRELSVPPDLAEALSNHPAAKAFFDRLSFTNRKEWVRWIEEARKAETREARLTKTIAGLSSGKSTH